MLFDFNSIRFPASIASLLVQMGREAGHSVVELLKDTSIPPTFISDPERRLSTEQYQRLIRNLLRLTGNPSLGIQLGPRVNILHLGMIGIVMMSYTSLKEAIRNYFHNWAALLPYFKPREIMEEEIATYEFRIKTDDDKLERFLHEFLISCTYSLACFITGTKLRLIEVCFTFPEPENITAYKECFGDVVTFEAARNCFRLEQSILNTRLWGYDIHTNSVAERMLRKKLDKLSQKPSLASEIYRLMFQNDEQIPDLPTIAKTLNLGVRTLGRRLEQENTSYQKILNRVRLELSLRLLEKQHLQINEIAYRLGYTNPSSFSRSFKQWTGKAPGLFREGLKKKSDTVH